ncbi:MAG: adenylosuccinate synthase [Planctomycetes bacterium]|nr:adenylosuccinate synthase [Planctomycetota bacterium]
MTPTGSATTVPAPNDEASVAALVRDLPLGKGHCAVVGLQWGDEGKGKIVDLLSRRYDLIVRYNGGANAGHSVQVGSERYALHLIPSGILNPDKLNVLGNGVVIDPGTLLGEIDGLRKRGVAIGANLRISDRAHAVFPYHKLEDALLEAAISKSHGDGQKIGTTGRGIGPCYADKAMRTTAVRMGELLRPDHLAAKLPHIVRVKNAVLAALAAECGQPFQPLDADELAKTYAGYGAALREHICDTTQLLHDSMSGGRSLLFEGANATLLDIDHGTYPFVTSSNCSSLGVHTGTGVPGHKVTNIVGIMKAYSTRVGGGPMPTELKDATGDRIREVGREYGTTTGRPRRCGWLDLVAVKYSAMLSGATGIGLMLLDVLSGHEKLRVCTAYRHNGKLLTAFPADAEVLVRVEPVYVDLPGFVTPVSECRRFADLPAQAHDYVKLIEKHVGVPVTIISVGPRRDQTLIR